ncbi:MAG: peptidoglycan editing factor PgeF [Bacillaceae bacterium]|nr:peptidoglycan editing factor PgeF [Bacillaceae bacterium]
MSEPFQTSGHPSILTISDWEKEGVTAGITTRKGGFSHPPYAALNMGDHVGDDLETVNQNRHHVAKLINFPLKNWVMPKQIHSTKIADISHVSDCTDELSCDGVITNQPGQLLTAVFADCVPLYFFALKDQWVGLAHAGWRGTAGGIAEKMVQRFVENGVQPGDLYVVIGPCIGKSHYEVDENVVQYIPDSYQKDHIIEPVRPGHYLLDLKQLNKEILMNAGILTERIEMTDYCTYDKDEWFYSHRRDQGKTGRMMAFIGIKDK